MIPEDRGYHETTAHPEHLREAWPWWRIWWPHLALSALVAVGVICAWAHNSG